MAKKGDGFYSAFINMDDARAEKMRETAEKLKEKKKPFSLAKFAKKHAKESFGVNKAFRKAASQVAEKGYQGVGVGHNHDPYIRDDEDGLYLNSGDWVEHCTALTHDENGEWTLIHWLDKRKEMGLKDFPKPEDDNPSAAYRSVTEKQLRAMQRIWPSREAKAKRVKISKARKTLSDLRSSLRDQEFILEAHRMSLNIY